MCCICHGVNMSNAGVSGKVEKIGWTCFCLGISFQSLHLNKQPGEKRPMIYDASTGRLQVQKNFNLSSKTAKADLKISKYTRHNPKAGCALVFFC